MKHPEYVGHFNSCALANNHAESNYKNAEYTTCLHEDYIFLPEGLIKRLIDENNK